MKFRTIQRVEDTALLIIKTKKIQVSLDFHNNNSEYPNYLRNTVEILRD